MRLFDYVDEALLRLEAHTPRISRRPSVWPSEASAVMKIPAEAPIIGKCHRAAYFRMTGEPVYSPPDAVALRRFRTGRAMEVDIAELAKEAGIFVASGVRLKSDRIDMNYELDIVVIDPKTKVPYIVENKSIYGYWAAKSVIKDGNPKLEAVLQICLYLNELQTGAELKRAIGESLQRQRETREELETVKTGADYDADRVEVLESIASRYRTEVDEDNLAEISDDVQVQGKLAYETRDDCQTREFDISLDTNPLTEETFPVIDGRLFKGFTVESIYDRFETLQKYWLRAIQEARRRLAERGLSEIGELLRPEEVKDAPSEFWEEMAKEVRRLPVEFLPPAEYEWRYSPDRVEELHDLGFISDSKYKKWKSSKGKNKESLGAWQCRYCPYRKKCVSLEYPDMRHLLLDLQESAA